MARKYDSFATLMALINGFGNIALNLKDMDYQESVDALAHQRQLDKEERSWNQEMEKVRIQVALDTARIQLSEKSQLENTMVNKGIFELFRADLGGPYDDVVDQYGTEHRSIKTPEDMRMLDIVDRNDHLNLVTKRDTTTMQAVVKYNKLAKSALSNYNAGSNMAMRLDINLNGLVDEPEMTAYTKGFPMAKNHYWRLGAEHYKGDPMIGLKVKQMLQGDAQALINLETEHGKDNVDIITRRHEDTQIQYQVIIPKSYSGGYDPALSLQGQLDKYNRDIVFNQKKFADLTMEIQRTASDILTVQGDMFNDFSALEGEFKTDVTGQVDEILGSLSSYKQNDMNGLAKQLFKVNNIKKDLTTKINALNYGQFRYGEMLRETPGYIDTKAGGTVALNRMLKDYEESDPERFKLTGGAGLQSAFSKVDPEARVQASLQAIEQTKVKEQKDFETTADEYYLQAKVTYAGTEENPFDIRDHVRPGYKDKMNDLQVGAFNTMFSLLNAREFVYYMNDNPDMREWVEKGLNPKDPIAKDIMFRTMSAEKNLLLSDDKLSGLRDEAMDEIFGSIDEVIGMTSDPVAAWGSALPQINRARRANERTAARNHFLTTFEQQYGYNPEQKIYESSRKQAVVSGDTYAPFGIVPTGIDAEEIYDRMTKTGSQVGMTKRKYPTNKAFGGTSALYSGISAFKNPYGSQSKISRNMRHGKYLKMSREREYGDSVYEAALAKFMWDQYDDWKAYIDADDPGYGRGDDLGGAFGTLSEKIAELQATGGDGGRSDGYLAAKLLGDWKDAYYKNHPEEGPWQKTSAADIDNVFKLAQDYARLQVIEYIKKMKAENDISLINWWNTTQR